MTDLVVKSNKLVQALQTLNLNEARLLQLAIVDARETGQGLSTEEPLELNAVRYAKAFNVSADAAYLALSEAEDSLFKRQFTITNEDGTLTKSRWIQDANYRKGEGRILVTLTRVVIEHVTKIDGFEQYFTSYHLKKTADFKSVYAVRLYELLMQWKAVGRTPAYELDRLRGQLGIGVNEYTRMEAFKRRVLDIAVDQINEHSDLIINYEQHKKGRSISGFSFNFKYKRSLAHTNKEIDVTQRPKIALTDAQRRVFAKKLSELPEMSRYSEGTESYPEFAVRITKMLEDPEQLNTLLPLLKKLGFKEKH
mgnify:FL=1